MTALPEVVTHNYDPRHGPCRNICELSRAEASAILEKVAASGGRKIKGDYLQRRLAVEDWLIAERKRKLGPTQRDRPIYFFLGDFADGRDASRPSSLVLPLAAFSQDIITFTYPDSMASLAIASREDHLVHRKEYHGQVFTWPELREMVAKYGMPGERWRIEPAMKYDLFIEMQLWDDRPIGHFLKNGLDAGRGTGG